MSSENQQPGVSESQVHQEGIDHIKSQTGQTSGGSVVPASNPGSEDASAGIPKDSGGVSSSAYVDSPVPSEQKGVVQSTVDTVKGLFTGLSLGGASTTAEKDGAGEPGAVKSYDEGNNESTAANTGVVASTTAAVSAATAAVLGSREANKTDGTRIEETKDSSSTVLPATDSTTTNTNPTATTTSSNTKDVPMTDASSTSAPTTSATRTATDEPKADTTSKDTTQTREETETAEKRGHDDADNKLSDAPGENASHAKKDNWPKENRDAIPTAGGEKLGEKHWGESEIVPDVPKKQAEESNVSSAEGQPDNQTRDNTAQNTGGAAAPPTTSSGGHDDNNAADGEGKQKFTDKIKDKLNIGKKE